MITRIEIDGFKTFRQFALDLEPFQVIVGLNAAGKSNLMDAFRFISKVVTSDVKTAYQEMWATAGELFTMLPDGKTADRMSFALEFLVPFARPVNGADFARMRYELSIRRTDGTQGTELTLQDELLSGLPLEHDGLASTKTSMEWTEFHQQVFRPSRRVPKKRRIFGSGEAVIAEPPPYTTLLGNYFRVMTQSGRAVFHALSQTAFLDLEPEAIRKPVSSQGPTNLKENGMYLPNVLARMQKQDEFLLDDLGADLANLVSGLIRVEVREEPALGHNLVWVHTAEGKRLSLRELSDGTLRLLSLATLRNDPDQQGTILIEEPENGVHPFRVKLLVSLLRSMASDFSKPPEPGEPLRQVIATTHSPILVSKLEDHEIIFAHTADVTPEGYDKPMRITRMSSLQSAGSDAQKAYTRREILRYLDEKDLETRTKRLRGAKP